MVDKSQGIKEGFENDTRLTCPNMQCPLTLVIMEVAHEDETVLYYSGACATCGTEFQLKIDKEKVKS